MAQSKVTTGFMPNVISHLELDEEKYLATTTGKVFKLILHEPFCFSEKHHNFLLKASSLKENALNFKCLIRFRNLKKEFYLSCSLVTYPLSHSALLYLEQLFESALTLLVFYTPFAPF